MAHFQAVDEMSLVIDLFFKLDQYWWRYSFIEST